jgi:hypothetical protein
MDTEADPGFLRQLSEATGGVAFRPENAGQIEEVLQRVARDIRNMYTIGYVPSPSVDATRRRKDDLREVSVDVRSPAGQKLGVRTRRAYLAGSAQIETDAH